MKKWWIAILCVLCLCGWTMANAENLMFVSAENADRVHLRAEPSTKAKSLGLYFTGTPVLCEYTFNEEWMRVYIGAEAGYMYKDRLVGMERLERIQHQWKVATVKPTSKTGWVNLRSAPTTDAPVRMKLEYDAQVVVMGETVSHWCYVKAGTQYGYMMSKYLRVSDRVWDGKIVDQKVWPAGVPNEWYYSSGAGAWGTSMIILPDGTFWGRYHDADMGDDGKDYPKGTLYECVFTGKYSVPERVDEWEHQLMATDVQTFGIQKNERIREETLVITTGPAGIGTRSKYRMFAPGVPLKKLPNNSIYNELSNTLMNYTMLYEGTPEIIWQANE